jgi:hypothetical protein
MSRKSTAYRILIWGLLIASLLLLWRLNSILAHPKYIPIDDFVRHWAGGILFLAGDDPFSIPKIQALQDQATGASGQTKVINTIYITPWSMILLAPFSLLEYSISRLAWLLFNVILSILSAELLWKTYDGPPQRKWLSWIIVFSFSPTISVLEKGQTGCLVLLGIAGFLHFEKLGKPFLGGAMAALISVKPQLIYLFWPAFLSWSIHRKNWSAFLGCGITILIASAASFALNPGIFRHYLDNVRFHSPLMWATPTIGGYLRYFIFGVEQFWPQYVGPLIGLGFFFSYWVKERHAWTWSRNTPALALASAITSFYSWTYDQVVLLAAVIKAWIQLIARGKSAWLLMASYFAIQLANLFLHRYLDDFWFIWFAPAMLFWYWAVGHKNRNEVSH